jgi:hypothetical protein
VPAVREQQQELLVFLGGHRGESSLRIEWSHTLRASLRDTPRSRERFVDQVRAPRQPKT